MVYQRAKDEFTNCIFNAATASNDKLQGSSVAKKVKVPFLELKYEVIDPIPRPAMFYINRSACTSM